MKVAVCIPHTGMIRARCARSLNELVAHTLSTRIAYNGTITQPGFVFLYEDKGPLEYKRTQLALKALDSGADYHLLIDWDHSFPPDALLRLAAHDLPVVGANYPNRHFGQGTAFAGQDRLASGHGVQPVASIGLGFALIKAEVFRTIERPWFQVRLSDAGHLECGEDVHFCNQVRRAGLPVFVDHDLRVGHIAEHVLTLEREGAHPEPDSPSSSEPR